MTKIFVFAGHGAGDPGAPGNGYTEAERVRVLAKRIKALGGDNVILGDANRNYYKDNGIGKLTISKEYQLVELHMDSNDSPGPHGAHVIIKDGFEPDAYDKALANFLGEILPGRSEKIVGRDDLSNPYRAAAKGYGYRLLECGFISNTNDVNIFNNRMDEIARGILRSFDIEAGSGETSAQTPPNKGYAGNSIVEYLNSIGKDSSFAAREIYAKQYGLHNYRGSADQNIKLLALMRGSSAPSTASHYAAFNNSSLVDGLKSIGVDASFNSRAKIATANGVTNYTGTASQNTKLLELAKKGKLKMH